MLYFFLTVNHWGLVCAFYGEPISSQACEFSGAQSQMWLMSGTPGRADPDS